MNARGASGKSPACVWLRSRDAFVRSLACTHARTQDRDGHANSAYSDTCADTCVNVRDATLRGRRTQILSRRLAIYMCIKTCTTHCTQHYGSASNRPAPQRCSEVSVRRDDDVCWPTARAARCERSIKRERTLKHVCVFMAQTPRQEIARAEQIMRHLLRRRRRRSHTTTHMHTRNHQKPNTSLRVGRN